MVDTPKFKHDRFLILQALSPGKGNGEYPLSHKELKRRSMFERKPLIFGRNIRAMKTLGWVSKNDDYYRITPRGKEVLSQWWAENYQDGKMEMFK